MNKQTAVNLVKDTFESPYDRDRFLNFSRNLLHSFEPATFIYRGNYIPDAYKKHIKTLERLGKYEDINKNKIDILAVCLYQDSTLERARTLQRNFISWYLNGSRGDVTKDAALVAFYVEDSHDWRLSLVKMEYRLGKSDAGRLKTFTELTPAKRFSFLVGENENTHTAQKQLLPSLINEETPPTLSDLEKVFNVEVVTKEFFEKYKQLFLDTKEALDKIVKADPQIENDFKEKNIETVDFTKKLLGQIVFLYFLQKKGWFGVARDENWGSGPKEFLRLLFEEQITNYKNYFNDILEPLFYEALAIERPDDFYSRFDCKIPFLNGGLFDPLNNYDWVHTDIRLPNHLFSNDTLTKEGDRGTGILDVFDRYNFTVKEDEPLEREVAVDPEMLGKVFENLLEVKDRKSKGTYYTPREIVHYMCQESLVNYLATELEGKAKKEDIETLVQIGEAAVEHDTRVTEIGEETDTYSYKLPASIRENAKTIDDALVNIRVCDPAVGSGAFLVGMMTEIIRVRNTISSYFVDGDRSIYTFKHHAIQNSLYGVDIDPGATEIAKLRLWLSLIVDEQDIKKIKPLPNLDYKIMQGNSLLEEFEGIKLFDEELFKKSAFDNTAQIEDIKAKVSELQREFFELYKNNQLQSPRKQQIETELQKYNKTLKKLTEPPKLHVENTGLFDQESEAKAKAKELKRLQKEFFNTSHKKEKDQIKKRIESLTWELIEATLREQRKESLMTQVEKFKKANIRPFFLWKLNYNEVFETKGGFDVIIANPPYVRADAEDPNYQRFRRALENTGRYTTLYEKWDLFIPFIEHALNLTNNKGFVSYIVSNAVCTSKYAFKLLDLIQDNYFLRSIDYFEKMQVFDAGVIPVVLMIRKTNNIGFTNKILHRESFENVVSNDQIGIEEFKKLGRLGFKKDYRAMNIKANTINLGDICYMSKGMVLNSDENTDKGGFAKGDLISTNKDIVHSKSYIEGKYLKKYLIEKIKYLEWNTKRVPSQLSRATFPELYDRPKIMRGRVTEGTYDDTGLVCNDSIVLLVKYVDLSGIKNKSISNSIQKFNTLKREELEQTSKLFNLKYLLAILNSRFANIYLNNIRRHRLENYFYPDDFRNLPIAEIPLSEQMPYVEIVDNIIALKKSGNMTDLKKAHDYESQIDKMVYILYDLKPEEIAIVEGDING